MSNLLSVQISHRIGALDLQAGFSLMQHWTVLFGPSGSGKTTILRAIAGLLQPDSGRIAAGTDVLFDRSSGVSVPPHARPVRTAGQSARLFPHMTVLDNLTYGLATQNQVSIIEDAVDRFHLRDLLQKSPRQLSGGERQRIAVVRAASSAISLGPRTLLLLDEPFVGLDLERRDQFLAALQPWLQQNEIPVLSVTHDVGETLQLASEVLRIADGKLIAQGLPSDVLASEKRRLATQLGAPNLSLRS